MVGHTLTPSQGKRGQTPSLIQGGHQVQMIPERGTREGARRETEHQNGWIEGITMTAVTSMIINQ